VSRLVWIPCALLMLTPAVRAATAPAGIEPDNYAEGTVLTSASPLVTLTTTLTDNVPVPSFVVTANTDDFGLAPTGTKVFGHANVPFFNDNRRLRMDFTQPVQGIDIAFTGSLNAHVGRLEAYDAGNSLVASYISQPRAGGDVEVLSVVRSNADIAWAVAYAAGARDFGRLDALAITVPEPGTALLALVALAVVRRR
jgi:hypothetical protein